MKRKNIDSLREIRLWIGQVIVPAVVGLGALKLIVSRKESKIFFEILKAGLGES